MRNATRGISGVIVIELVSRFAVTVSSSPKFDKLKRGLKFVIAIVALASDINKFSLAGEKASDLALLSFSVSLRNYNVDFVLVLPTNDNRVGRIVSAFAVSSSDVAYSVSPYCDS